MCRKDVASLLVDMLLSKSSIGKTVEAISVSLRSQISFKIPFFIIFICLCPQVPGYPKPRSYADQLQRLRSDSDGPLSEKELAVSYGVLQQLLPGETLAPNALAMGQTYEQLDKGERGRLGLRGEEEAPITRAG
jgi:hypothetical protein